MASFKELVDSVNENQRKYLISKALGASEREALRDGGISDNAVDRWEERSPAFNEAIEMIKRGEAVKEALGLWMGERLPKFLVELERLATDSETGEKVKLDAIKYCISLAGTTTMKVEVEQTLMEKYVLDKAELTVTKKLTKGVS